MIIDVDEFVLDIYGRPIKNRTDEAEDAEEIPLLTRGDVLIRSLMLPNDDGKNPDAKRMMERYDLAQKIVKGGEVEITSTEAADLLKQIARVWNVAIYGALHNLLEGKEDTKSNGKGKEDRVVA